MRSAKKSVVMPVAIATAAAVRARSASSSRDGAGARRVGEARRGADAAVERRVGHGSGQRVAGHGRREEVADEVGPVGVSREPAEQAEVPRLARRGGAARTSPRTRTPGPRGRCRWRRDRAAPPGRAAGRAGGCTCRGRRAARGVRRAVGRSAGSGPPSGWMATSRNPGRPYGTNWSVGRPGAVVAGHGQAGGQRGAVQGRAGGEARPTRANKRPSPVEDEQLHGRRRAAEVPLRPVRAAALWARSGGRARPAGRWAPPSRSPPGPPAPPPPPRPSLTSRFMSISRKRAGRVPP